MAIAIYNKENIITEIRPDEMVNWIEPFDEEGERFIEWNLPEGKEPPKYIAFPDEDMDVYSDAVGKLSVVSTESGITMPDTEAINTAKEQISLDVLDRDNRMLRDSLFSKADVEVYKLEDDGIDATAWRQYRKALRDITLHEKWPNLSEEDWPIKPEIK